MKTLILFAFLFISASVYADPPNSIGEYRSADEAIIATITQDGATTLSIEFKGYKEAIKYPLFTLDSEFIQWHTQYFGDTDIREEMGKKDSAYFQKANDLMDNKTDEPEKMIKKWKDAFVYMNSVAEALLLMSNTADKEKYSHYLNSSEPDNPKLIIFNNEVVFIGIGTDTLWVASANAKFELKKQ